MIEPKHRCSLFLKISKEKGIFPLFLHVYRHCSKSDVVMLTLSPTYVSGLMGKIADRYFYPSDGLWLQSCSNWAGPPGDLIADSRLPARFHDLIDNISIASLTYAT